ncbi:MULTISPECIES: amidohydrolase family protein [unclassified Flavobacterium]|jgi:imidazolonepropionase-like amidohydrolase|uniref:amidohydrolase family protein n=1 Tax=unclassified Flavobacterium TaxID=196869 RepID=UPI0025C587C8|nr:MULTISPECIES: amidohydrolase family protein [unclassified Flavobacterium]
MKNIIILSLFTLLSFLFGCKNYYTKELIKKSDNTFPILITEVNIFNGKDSTLILNKDVVIENGFIKVITNHFIPIKNKSYKIINGKGKTLMPGLIDAHVHLSGSGSVPWKNVKANEKYNLSAYLYAGITTVYDMGGTASSMEKLSEKVEKGTLLGPTIYHAHIPITIKNSHPIPLSKEILGWPLKLFVGIITPTIKNTGEAKKIIEKYTNKKVDYVKIICDQIPPDSPEMPFPLLKALIDESHKKGYKVFVHMGSPEDAVNAVKAGADVLAHGIWRGKLTPEQADVIANSKVPVIYTLAAFQNVNSINKGEYIPNKYDTLLVPKIILDPVTKWNGLDIKNQPVMSAFFNDVTNKSPYWLDNFKLLHNRNVTIVLGTDSLLPGTYAGSTFLQEIDVLKEYGMTNFEILTGSTYLSSKLFLQNPDFGSVEVGKKANLLLINGNPLVNLKLVKTPETILMNGTIILKIKS